MGFDVNEISVNSKGGTELMRVGLEERLPADLLENFQIFASRVREKDDSKIRVLWMHDLPGDSESDHLKNDGHEAFHLFVFVSNWQMQQFINTYGIPWSKCVVIENAIDAILPEQIEKPKDVIRLVYHTTPHRGLEILVPVFEKLCETHDNIVLDVYSSFEIYGWTERDAPYQEIFDRCRNHPKINYHGTVSNEEVKLALGKSHIFAYPSIWPETSCISLIEAMSAQCICVHPNYGALFETAGGTTLMYQWHEDLNAHAGTFFNHLEHAINSYNEAEVANVVRIQCSYANLRYNWNRVSAMWTDLLKSLLTKYPGKASRAKPGLMFHYKVN